VGKRCTGVPEMWLEVHVDVLHRYLNDYTDLVITKDIELLYKKILKE